MTVKTLTAALALTLAAAGAARADGSTFLEAVCLEGGRSEAVCRCADQKLLEMIGDEKYNEYAVLAEARMANPSQAWDGAIAKVAADRGVDAETLKTTVIPSVQLHRQIMRDCN